MLDLLRNSIHRYHVQIAETGRCLGGGALLFIVITLLAESLRPGLVMSYVSPFILFVWLVASGIFWSVGEEAENTQQKKWSLLGLFFLMIALSWCIYAIFGGWVGLVLACVAMVVFFVMEMIE